MLFDQQSGFPKENNSWLLPGYFKYGNIINSSTIIICNGKLIGLKNDVINQLKIVFNRHKNSSNYNTNNLLLKNVIALVS